MAESNLNLDLNSTSSAKSPPVEIEPIEEQEGNSKDEQISSHSTWQFPTQRFPLDLSKKGRRCSKSSSSVISTDPFKFMLSDSNPLCSQLYLEYANYQGKLRRWSSSLESGEAAEADKSATRTREWKKNIHGQRSRDAERYKQCALGVQEIQMNAHNISLQTQVKNLTDARTRLMQLVRFWKS